MFRIFNRIIKLFASFILIIILAGLVVSIFYPIGYKNSINKYSKEYKIDPYLVASIINVESKYNKDAISNKEARGLMQIGPKTGEWASEVLNIKNYDSSSLYIPDTNIRIGTWYLDQLNKEFDNKNELVLAAYNAGSGNVNKWLLDDRYSKDGKLINIPFKETDDYINRVKKNYKIYKLLYKSYMEKPDTIYSIYIDAIINIRNNIIKAIKSLG